MSSKRTSNGNAVSRDPSGISGPQVAGNVHLLRRVMVILKVVAAKPTGMNIADIAIASGMPRTTVQRLVEAMEDEGLLFSPPNSKLYRLGFALRQLVDTSDWRLTAVARPFLEELSSSLNETASLALFNKDSLVYADVVLGARMLQAVVPIGTPMPLHSLASGKAMLALLDEQALTRVRAKIKLQKFTPNTITSWDRLDKEIVTIRRSGYAADLGENSPEIGAVAAAFASASGELVAISISGPVERITKRQNELLAGLKDARARLKKALAGLAE